MTTIVVHNGDLHADRMHVRVGVPCQTFTDTKIFKSADGQFAYGCTGRRTTPEVRPGLEAILRRGLEVLMTTDMGDQKPVSEVLNEDDQKRLKDFGHFIVTTKTLAFIITPTMFRTAHDATMGVGTGCWIVIGMIDAGVPPSKALVNAGDHDTCTGNGTDSILRKSLKPFVIKGEDKCR